MKVNKKVLIGGGIAAFIIGAIAGLYVYTKKSIGKIAAAIDDTFDIGEENKNDTIQYQFDTTKVNKNNETITPKDEARTIKFAKVPNFTCYDAVDVDHTMQDNIDKLRIKVEELENKINSLTTVDYTYLFDDKNYKDYMNTMEAYFGDDGK